MDISTRSVEVYTDGLQAFLVGEHFVLKATNSVAPIEVETEDGLVRISGNETTVEQAEWDEDFSAVDLEDDPEAAGELEVVRAGSEKYIVAMFGNLPAYTPFFLRTNDGDIYKFSRYFGSLPENDDFLGIKLPEEMGDEEGGPPFLVTNVETGWARPLPKESIYGNFEAGDLEGVLRIR